MQKDHTVTCTVRGQNGTANHCFGFDISAATGKVLGSYFQNL